MKSYPDSATVLAGLGDKAVDALRQAVALAAADFADYRRAHPLWVAQASERGLANWIHDRLWSHLIDLLDGVPGVTAYDKEPRREVTFGLTYKLRLKRHHEDGQIRTYPTPTAELFFAQEPLQLPLGGMEEVRLAAGYEWDRTERAIGDPVITLRSSRANIIWRETLPPWMPGAAGGTIHIPTVPGPTQPTVAGPAIDMPKTDESGE